MTIRIAVIGIGARAHIARHARVHGGEIVAVVDPDPTREAAARELFGEDIRWRADAEDLDLSAIDAAFLTSPDHTHAQLAIPLLHAGVGAYVEKPLDITTAAADAVLEAAFSGGGKLYIGHNMRHMALVQGLRQVINRGEIGEVKAIWCRHFVGHGGDYYFKDWHAEREKTGGLLLQKGAHDIDVMHYLAGGYSTRVVGMGQLGVYDQIVRRRDNSDRRMRQWFSLANWPPLSQRDLNPVIDVEDLSAALLQFDNGVQATYSQCHYTPDYWRNYTVIGTAGRVENFGDGAGGVIRVWNQRGGYRPSGDAEYPIGGDDAGHQDADVLTVGEFCEFLRSDIPTETSPIAARYAVAAAAEATASLRAGSTPRDVPPLRAELADYFARGQQRSAE